MTGRVLGPTIIRQRPGVRARSGAASEAACANPLKSPVSRSRKILMRVFNFSAGPAVLPEPVLRQAAAEMLDWHGSGMSVMEMSHRGKEFISIADKAEADLRTLLAIPANYKVLFLQGGAIAENAIVPMNLLRRPHDGRLHQHRRVVEEVDQGSEEVLHGERRRVVRGPGASRYVPRAERVEAERRPGLRARLHATRRSAASNTSGRRTPATCRWWPTCRRTSCRARSTSRSTA